LVLGTETYNPHPESGKISIIDAYELVRRWNAKECYLVGYSGLLDSKKSKNEWYKGPSIFRDDILISDIDANRLKKYFQENFVASSK
jgi:hypothetical protein